MYNGNVSSRKNDANKFRQRQMLDVLEGQLRTERTTFRRYWRDLSTYILPRRSKFFVSDVNQGDRRTLEIIDPTASMASRTLSSGMMSGVTSPARPWFKLDVDDPVLSESGAVKEYLAEVTKRMRGVFLRSNLYNALPVIYGDLGTFATGCMFMEEDMDDVVNFTVFPIGSYMLANDKRGKVRTFFREFQMSIRQIVEKFGMMEEKDQINWTNISESVRRQWEAKQYETMVDIGHWVLPNEDYKFGSPLSKHKKYKSIYYEKGLSSASNNRGVTSGSFDKFLSEKGYDFFPVMAPRWEVAGEDTYGTNSPGMMILGDVKQLQLQEKRIAEAIEQKVRPSMIGPTSLRNQYASILPGDITYLDEREGNRGFRRLFELDFDVRELEGKQEQIRQRISKAFYEDLFLMLANSNRRQITAREIDERVEEKLLGLGPVLERINQDLLDPLIENTFIIMERQGLLPEAPEELEGRDYKIEYVSVMAQAQKLAGIGNIERLLGFVGQVGQLDPAAVQKLDVDQTLDLYGDLVGVPPNVLRSKEEMDTLREDQEAAAMAEQEAVRQAQEIDAAKTLSETKINEDNALQRLLEGDVG